ncbi:MAG TPA: serine/threonine-protein kinase [Chiayiivirga sp.]|mgnify:CR=1 FL=1|nr:serine/threonine-protein kinase [Xanthomonadaceae bacterium]HMN33790.1 serine/threonine-protein kinase [Chiayiivirga sp.]
MNHRRSDDTAHWRRQSVALDDLLDLDAAAQAEHLARIALDDPAFAEELKALLAAEAGEGPLERGLGALAHEALEQAPDAASRAGIDIGHWHLIAPLGRGGMGEVFLAQRREGDFTQRAALKRLRRGMDSEDILQRFLQERRILASLTHPNIARLLDGGMDADGRPYLVMEHVEGVPITDWAREHGLPLRQRLALMRKVCEAVAYAQSRLVVHRDLKPSNILVDTEGEPHLLDFGIAKLLDDAPDAHHTRTGLRALSPAYAAPEQINGQTISTATDVHALGVVLYELLTGQLPYRRERALTTGSATSAEYDSLVRPSQALRRLDAVQLTQRFGASAPDPARLARQLVGDLDRIVLTALRPEPERRYPSAAALGADLGAFLDGRPISARPDSSSYRLRKFVLRHRIGVAATALVLIALIAGFGTALWQARIAHKQAHEATRQRVLAEQHLARAEKTRDFVVSLIRDGNPEQSRGGAQTTALDLIRNAAMRVDALTDAPDTQAQLQVAIGEGLIALGAAEEGRARLDAGTAQLRTLGEDAWPALADALQLSAKHDTASGRLIEARAAGQESLALYDRLDRRDLALGRIATLTTLAKNTQFQGDFSASQTLYERILAERRELLGPDDPRLAVDWNNLGATAIRRDRYADAEHAYRQASRLMALDPQAPESRQAWLQLGRASALIGLGRFDDAQATGLHALDIAERTLHPEHPIVANICSVLARLYRYTGRLDAAAAMAERARAIFTATHATQLGSVETHLGLIRLAQGHDTQALAVLTDAEHHFATLSNREEPEYFLATAAQAFARLRQGEADALAALEAALEELRHRHREPNNALAETLALRTDAAVLLRHDDVAQWREREIAALAALLGAAHPRTQAAPTR